MNIVGVYCKTVFYITHPLLFRRYWSFIFQSCVFHPLLFRRYWSFIFQSCIFHPLLFRRYWSFIFQSCIFHPLLFRRYWSFIFQSCIFQSCIFSAPSEFSAKIAHLQATVDLVSEWMSSNLLSLNQSNTEFLLIGLPALYLPKIPNPI